MSNLKFREDGPIVVPEFDFRLYQTINPSTVTKAFYIWIDEHHPDEVRRLALRDAIRHHATKRDGAEVAHGCDLSCGGFAIQKDPSLEQVLRLRPKLLGELVDELVYCLSNMFNLYDRELDFLIETILKVAGDVEEYQKFWSFHSLAGDPPVSQIRDLLRLCQADSGLPEWVFEDKVWPRLKKRALADLNSSEIYYEDSQLGSHCVTSSEYFALSALCDYMENAYIYIASSEEVAPRSIRIAETVADFLDENLSEFVLFSWHLTSITQTTELFTNRELAYRILRRHLLRIPLTNEKGSPTVCRDQKFWLWLYGLVMYIAPVDKKFLDRIKGFVDLNAGELQLEYH